MHTADEAWLHTISEIFAEGKPVEPQASIGANGRVSFEILCHTMAFDMKYPIVTMKPMTSWLYMAAEPMWVLAGENSLYFSQEIQTIQKPYSDDNKRLAGAYGPPFKSQLQYVVDLLNKDKNSRQAVMTIWRKRPEPSKDIPCTVAIQWLIRDNQLNAIVTMRSSDVGMGLPYDMLTFTCMSAEIASLVGGVELGTCFITAGSRHIYTNQFAQLEDVLSKDADGGTELGYEYEAWATWKWPAIKERLKRATKLTWNDPITRADAQIKARQLILGEYVNEQADT
jgi:thymidylate synthase